MSGVSSNALWISSAWASILCERMSPPCRFGAKDPVARRPLSQRIAVDGAIPYRAAAARRLMPASIAAITPLHNILDAHGRDRFERDGEMIAGRLALARSGQNAHRHEIGEITGGGGGRRAGDTHIVAGA